MLRPLDLNMIPKEEISNINLLDESRVNQMSTNCYMPLMDIDDIMESFMDMSF
jgi:hypothetical protein